MTFNLKNAAHIFRAKLKERSALPKSREAKALVQWKILVAVFFALTVLVLFSSVWVYQSIGRGNFLSATPPSTVKSGPVTKELLDKTIKDFSTKSATFDQIRKNHSWSADPSL